MPGDRLFGQLPCQAVAQKLLYRRMLTTKILKQYGSINSDYVPTIPTVATIIVSRVKRALIL